LLKSPDDGWLAEKDPGSERSWKPEAERLAGVLARAHTELMAALAELQSLRQELGTLVACRLTRPWTADEFARYLRITAAERRAHRRYLAARMWFHAALKRIRRLLPPRESVPPPE
jgi:hypothetical protein